VVNDLGGSMSGRGSDEGPATTVAAEIGEAAVADTNDISTEAGARALIATAIERFGRIDALVNNAGGQFPARLSAISAKGWDAVVRNNLTGGFLVARECVNQWMLSDAAARPGGAIVNIVADMWGGMPGMAHSGAARAGMVNFTETAALEWAPVRVNAVAPGWIASSGLDRYPAEMAEKLRTMQTLVPLQRLGTESEISAAIVFLLTPAAAFVSGACLRVDGAAPNAKRIWPEVGSGGSTLPFDGFHLAAMPRVLRDD
jgi:citronellol/citronellal dehydrogenase